eukprot:CAMPEP_0119389654 /NCGR_PEP_ID=MMETSP1334-20130426/110345_1 /TAXON_ID=127549 /ORGANISM="Calcidiscus leptoporus, Strain RCC1130" /LENGTH=96 /DNA_ID=CAMNT_0007411967 /DNA_START=349 /DNA_END=635 /DNA_ORIENTATION=-
MSSRADEVRPCGPRAADEACGREHAQLVLDERSAQPSRTLASHCGSEVEPSAHPQTERLRDGPLLRAEHSRPVRGKVDGGPRGFREAVAYQSADDL